MLLQGQPLLLLLLLSTIATQMRGETMVDIFLEFAETTLPCAVPCVLQNLAEITTAVNKTCLPDFMSAVQRTFTPPKLTTRPPPGPTGAPGLFDMQYLINNNVQSINQQIFNSQFICDDVRKMFTCATNELRGKCGAGLANGIIQQQSRLMAYYGCSGSHSNKDAAIKCQINPAVTNATVMCVHEFTSGPHAADIEKLSTTPYEKIYTDYLSPVQGTTNPPKICQFAETYTDCIYKKIEALQLAECGAPAVQQMKDETNALLDLVNCRTYNPRHDGLTCMANPKLIEDVSICINARVQKQSPMFLKSFIPGQNPPFSSSFDFSKMCDLVELMDECIESKLKAEAACQGGWTMHMYRSIVTPFRDFLLNKHCSTTARRPSNSLGYGTCKNQFRDFPYGRPDPSSGHLALSSILGLTLTCLVSLLVVN